VELSVVIPAFNENTRLPPMLDVALSHLTSKKWSRTYEIIIVDDGSADSTSATAIAYAQAHRKSDIRVVTLLKNRGKGGAVKNGMLHARGRRLLMVDADGASQFEDVDLLWKAMDEAEKGGLGVAIGSRAHLVTTEAVVKRSFVRNFLMYSFHFILGLAGVGGIRDTQCGFKLFTRSAAQSLFPSMHISSWIFDVELLMLSRMLNIPVCEVPIAWHEVSGSKLSIMADSMGMLRDLILLKLNYGLGRWGVNDKSRKTE